MRVMITIMLSHPRLMTVSNKSVYLDFKGQETMNVEQTFREILESHRASYWTRYQPLGSLVGSPTG